MSTEFARWFTVITLAIFILSGSAIAGANDFAHRHEVQANTFTASSQSDASITNLHDGGFVVAWHSRRQQIGTYGVYMQRFSEDGQAIDGEKQVNVFSKNMQMKPAVVATATGDVWVAWESFGQDGSLNAIIARRFNSDGVGGDEILVNQSTKGNQSDVVIASTKAGQATFYWVTNSADNKRKCIVGRTFANDGKPLTDEFVVCPSKRHQALPCVDTQAGHSVIVWAELDRHGRPAGIYGHRQATGDKPARKFRVDTDSKHASIEPAVCINSSGEFAVSWLQSVGNEYEVMVRKFDRDGGALSDAIRVSKPNARYVSGAAIESDTADNFVVAWNQQTDDMGKDINIFGQLFDGDGNKQSSIFSVNNNQSGRHRLTAASGKRRVAWDSQSEQLRLAWHGHNDVDGSSVNITAFVKNNSFAFSRPTVSAVAQTEPTARPHDPPTFNPKLIAEDPFGGFDPLDNLGPAGGDFGFNAINSTGWNPPDPVVAAGPNHVIAMTNGAIAFFDKAGTLTFSDQIEGAGGFWGAEGAGGFVFDPEVLWDPHSNRYFAMANERNGSLSFFLIAVSDDDDPNGNWFKYRLDVTNIADSSIDSPNFAVDDEVVYLTADFFGPNRFLVYMLRKSDLLVGDPVVDTNLLINGSHSYGVPMTYDADAPAFYMIQAFEFGNFSTIRLHAITDQLGNPQRVMTDVTVPAYGHPQDPPQQGTTSRPELFEARFWSCVYRDGSLWAVHHHSPNSTGVVRARWYEFAMNDWPVSGQTPQLVQSGEITDTNNNGQPSSIFFPSIWVDDLGNAAITTARSSNSEFISMSRAVRSVQDPPNTFQDLQLVQASTTGFNGGRWGDYSGTSDDPVDPAVFWGIHEYALSAGIWRTYIARYEVDIATVDIPATSVFADVGTVVSGDFTDLQEADDESVEAIADFSNELSGQGLSFQVSGNSVDTEFNVLKVAVTSRVGTPNLIQEIELFNFVELEFQVVDSRAASLEATSIEVDVSGNVSEFITPGSGSLLARVRYKPTGPTLFFPWRASLDEFVWKISD